MAEETTNPSVAVGTEALQRQSTDPSPPTSPESPSNKISTDLTVEYTVIKSEIKSAAEVLQPVGMSDKKLKELLYEWRGNRTKSSESKLEQNASRSQEVGENFPAFTGRKIGGAKNFLNKSGTEK